MQQTVSHGIARANIRSLPISSIRKDGKTQHRAALNAGILEEYTALMLDGVVLPPIRVWHDGSQYWLSDGFHRIAAAECADIAEISAEIRGGSLSDAQWDSFSANTAHGLRWTQEETQQVIQTALAHANAGRLSNVELAKHMHLSENTIRRWRKKLSSPLGDDRTRMVRRGNTIYPQATDRIGKGPRARRVKSREDLRLDVALMKEKGSPKVRRLLVIVANWALGTATSLECLDALEAVVRTN